MSQSSQNPDLRTSFAKKKAAREDAIYDRYHALMALPKAMATAVQARVMHEFDIHAKSSVYDLLERVKQRRETDTDTVAPPRP